MNAYVQGQIVKVPFYFQDPETRERFTPDDVTVEYGNGSTPAGTMTWVTGGATVPAVGAVAMIGTGSFIAEIDTTTLLGIINVQAYGSGGVQGIGLHQFEVLARYF